MSETRSDGWPLCPRCGHDELWSPLVKHGPPGCARTPTLEEYLEADDFRCYVCGFRGGMKEERAKERRRAG